MLKRCLIVLASVCWANSAFAQRDAIDLSQAVVWNSPQDVASWPISSRIESMTMRPEGTVWAGVALNFASRSTWPNYTPPGWDGPIQYTLWAGVNINGVWHVSGFMQMWRERTATGAPILTVPPSCGGRNNFACNWAYDGRWGALNGYQPRAGEAMVFFATAGNARGVTVVTSVRQRTNVVMVNLPANDYGDWTFAATQTDLLIDLGSNGLWTLLDATTTTQIHQVNPKTIVSGDIDGNGFDEAVVDFGSAYGIWVKWNNSQWTQLHPLTASGIVMGDLDGNGRSEVIVNFPSYGLWSWNNGSSWANIHPLNASRMAVSRTGTLVLNFAGQGIWIRRNTGAWSQLHPLNATDFVTGDFDGSGTPDVAVAFPGHGVWIYRNDSTWWHVNSLDALRLSSGDLDTNTADDLVADFGSSMGVWSFRNAGGWAQVHPLTSQAIVLGDLDGNGLDDIVIDFGSPHGVWVLGNLTSWVQAYSSTTESIVAGRFN